MVVYKAGQNVSIGGHDCTVMYKYKSPVEPGTSSWWLRDTVDGPRYFYQMQPNQTLYYIQNANLMGVSDSLHNYDYLKLDIREGGPEFELQ